MWGGLQDGGAAKGMTDQKIGWEASIRQMSRSLKKIFHIGGKMRVGEFSFRVTQPGKIKPQHCDAQIRQFGSDAARGGNVLGAGEAMREQRNRPDF
jgi:hypothetical protein